MRRIIVASWLALCALSAHAQVTLVTVGKQIQYVQTSAAGVAIAADRPYEFFGNVRGPGPPTASPLKLSHGLHPCVAGHGANCFSHPRILNLPVHR